MIINPITVKKIHFGSSLYQDYTKHGDDKGRKRFQQRNHKWKNAEPYTYLHTHRIFYFGEGFNFFKKTFKILLLKNKDELKVYTIENPKCVKFGLYKPLAHSPKIMSCCKKCRIYLAKYYIDTKIKHSKWKPNFY
jgi:hypothetical protein